MKIALFGYGKMGKAVEHIAHAQGDEIILKISKDSPLDEAALCKCDVCIDFSHAESVLSHVYLAARFKKPLVIGTTGWEKDFEEVKKVVEESQIGVLYSPNFSLGVHAFIDLLKHAKRLFQNYACIGVETHHTQKKDAPSGTAKAISKALEMKEGFSSIRQGNATGKHEIFFDSPFDTIHLIHEAKNRDAFAEGALIAARWLKDKIGWFTLDDLSRSLYSISHAI